MKRAVAVVVTLLLVVVGASSAVAQTTTTKPKTTPTTTSETTASTTAGPASTTAPAGAVRGVTATSIKVGGLGYSFLYGGADVGARARFQRANDSGGVNGRTIDYSGFTDDGGDPATGTTAAKTLVEQDGVFAVVPVVTPDLAASSYLVDQKVPWFGWALSSNFCGNRFGFGFTGCPFPENATSNAWPMLLAKTFPDGAANHTVGIVAENTPTGKYDVAALSAAAKNVKFKVTYAAMPLGIPATPDYGPAAQAVLTSNAGKAPDAVFVLGGSSNVLGMQQALTAANYAGVVTNQIQYAPNLVAPAVNATVFTQTAPLETADSAAMKQLVADVQKVAPDQPIDQSVVAGYWSADLFLAALQKAGKKLTSAALVKAANAKFTYEVADTVGPTTFPAAHSLPTPCGALVSSNGTAYAVKVPYACGRVVPVK